jgi:uncharacterized protein with GYD domain
VFTRGSDRLFALRGEKDLDMATYIALVSFTDQGVRHIRQTTERAKALSNAATNLGVKIKDIYWTMGAFDAVFIADAPDDETVAAFAVSMGSLGNIRTQTLRAFSAEEMNRVLEKVPAGSFVSAK